MHMSRAICAAGNISGSRWLLFFFLLSGSIQLYVLHTRRILRYTQTGLRSESSSQPRNIMHPFCDHICVVTVFFSYRIFFLGRVRGSPKLLKLAQAANSLPAPFSFSTPFYKIRRQVMADFAERCLFSCEKTPQYCINSSLTCDFSPLYKKAAAFLVRATPHKRQKSHYTIGAQ